MFKFKSKKQRQMEKEQKALEEKKKKAILMQWYGAILLMLLGLLALAIPSISMVFFFLAGAAIMPIEPIKNLWSKIPIKGKWFKPTVIAIVACIAFGTLPSSDESKDANVAMVEETTTVSDTVAESTVDDKIESQIVEEKVNESATEEITQEITQEAKPETNDQEATAGVITVSSVAVNLSDIPIYSGNAYIEINGNAPYFNNSELTTTAFENYSTLDSLGRCGIAYANICQEIMPTEERGEIGSVKPSGWQTVKYDCVDGKYLYNRCHLIGFQLAGENANTQNLITGTRYMNVEGMLPFENMVADYVKETNNHVLYRVTPVFDGNNLVVSGVLIEAESVEDNGDGISFNVYCYNNQPGVSINYADGSSQLDGSFVTAETESASLTTNPSSEVTSNEQALTPAATDNSTPTVSGSFAVNGKNGKIHMVGVCAATGTGDSAMTNPVYFNTYEEAEAYSVSNFPSLDNRKCGNCW